MKNTNFLKSIIERGIFGHRANVTFLIHFQDELFPEGVISQVEEFVNTAILGVLPGCGFGTGCQPFQSRGNWETIRIKR